MEKEKNIVHQRLSPILFIPLTRFPLHVWRDERKISPSSLSSTRRVRTKHEREHIQEACDRREEKKNGW
jgi:hypothetical protein